MGMIPSEFRRDLMHPKTRIPGPSCGVVCMIPRLAVLVQFRIVRRTDGRTDTRIIANTALAYRRAGKK